MLALDREGIRIAILDLYNGEPNEGIRCIYDLIESFSREVDMEIVTDTFAIRYEEEVPDLSYDIYISSGARAAHWRPRVCRGIANILNS